MPMKENVTEDTSLIQMPDGEAAFVYWSSFEERLGRRVRLTDESFVLTLVPARDKTDRFAGCRVIVNRTGVTQRRGEAKKGETQIMPSWITQLKWLLEIKQYGGPFQRAAMPKPNQTCALCAAAKEAEIDQEGDLLNPTELMACSCCLTSWHMECSTSPLVAAAAAEHTTIPCDAWPPGPDAWRCPFCSE